MRLPSICLLVSAFSLLHSAPSAASVSASVVSPTVGQAVPGSVNISRPLTGQAVLQAQAVGETASVSTDNSIVIPVEIQAWDEVLRRHLAVPDETGLARFDYAALSASTTDNKILSNYIAYLEARDPDDMSESEAIVFWANLYNAVTIRLIVDHYPVKSIKKIKSGMFSSGPWSRKLITVNGERLSLDNVEHDILRKQFPSPLIHYMVNCASIGCPNLKAGLWTTETIEADQERAAREFINSPRGVVITEDGLVVSSIYKWFRSDFGGSWSGVLAHLNNYADPELAQAIELGIKIDDHDYDWSLNGVHDNE